MSLFSRKKKEEKILPLPEFPRLPNEPNLPFYDEQLLEKKEQMPRFNTDFKKVIPESFSFEEKLKPSFEKEEIFEDFAPRRTPLTIEKRDEKPLFVKIEKYKESIKTIEEIKSKLESAENILKNLTKIREDEQKEIEDWQNSLNEARQKLLKVDKNLFEI